MAMALQRTKSTKLKSQTSNHLKMDYNLGWLQNTCPEQNWSGHPIDSAAYFTSCQFLQFTFTRPYIKTILFHVANYTWVSQHVKWTHGDRWHYSQNVTSIHTSHFHRLIMSYLSVPMERILEMKFNKLKALFCHRTVVRNWMNWKHFKTFVQKCIK